MIFAISCKISESVENDVNYDDFCDLDRKWTKIVARRPKILREPLKSAENDVNYEVSGGLDRNWAKIVARRLQIS